MGMFNTVKIEMNLRIRGAHDVQWQTKDIEPLLLTEYRMDRRGNLWLGDEPVMHDGQLRVIGFIPGNGRMREIVFNYIEGRLDYFATCT